MFDWSSADAIFLPIALAIMIIVTIVVHFTLQDRAQNVRKIPLYVIMGLIVALELAKQIYFIATGYDYSVLPLHFYNLLVFAFPLMLFAKGKFHTIGNALSLIVTSMLLICFYLSPDSIIGADATKNFLSSFSNFCVVAYIHLAFLYLFVGLSLDLFDFNEANIVFYWAGLLVYFSFVIIFSFYLRTDFVNFIESAVPLLETLRVEFGMIIYSVVMFLISAGIGGIVFVFERFIYERINDKI